MKSFIYLMELEEGFYYIDKTNDINKLSKHDINSKWIDIHKPVQVHKIIEDNEKFPTLGNVLTLVAMKQFGIDNVRGCGYSEVYFSKRTLFYINNFIRNIGGEDNIVKLIEMYDRIRKLNYKIYKCSEILGLNHEELLDNYERLEKDPEFISLDTDKILTRSKKRKLFGNVEFNQNL